MLDINDCIRIPEEAFSWSFVRSGRQNINKVTSKAMLRWKLTASPSMLDDVKERLCAWQHQRITGAGHLLLTSVIRVDHFCCVHRLHRGLLPIPG